MDKRYDVVQSEFGSLVVREHGEYRPGDSARYEDLPYLEACDLRDKLRDGEEDAA